MNEKKLIEKIVEIICRYYDIEDSTIIRQINGGRLRSAKEATHMIWYMCYHEVGMNQVEIAKEFNRNHGTVSVAIRRLLDKKNIDIKIDQIKSLIHHRS